MSNLMLTFLNFKKMKKVLDKTDLIRYNKQAVAENDNKTKNLDN